MTKAHKSQGIVLLMGTLALEACAVPRPRLAAAVPAQQEACKSSKPVLLAAGPAAASAEVPRPEAGVAQRVQKVLVETLRITPEKAINADDLVCAANADSLDVVEVVMALEEEFDLKIADEDAIEQIWSFSAIVSYIQRRLETEDRV